MTNVQILSLHQICPCGSNIEYGNCCREKGIIYKIDKKGNIIQEIEENEELSETTQLLNKNFVNLFNRRPSKYDRLFFDQYLYTGDDIWRVLQNASNEAGIPEKLLFCSRVTGRIISELNQCLVPDIDLDAWQEAGDWYDQLEAQGVDPFAALDFENPSEYVLYNNAINQIKTSIIASGSIIDREQSRATSNDKFVILYFFSRIFNLIKLFYEICPQYPSRDAISILRPIYECTLRIKFIIAEPGISAAFLAQSQIGTENVTHKKLPNGQISKSTIVDQHTGEEFPARFQYKHMVERTKCTSNIFIHDELYPYLSTISHADISDLGLFFSPTDGYFHQGHKKFAAEAPMLACGLMAMLFDAMSKNEKILKLSKRDLRFFSKKLANCALMEDKLYSKPNIFRPYPTTYLKLLKIQKMNIS